MIQKRKNPAHKNSARKSRQKVKSPQNNKLHFNLLDWLIFATVAVVSAIILVTGINNLVAVADSDRPGLILNLTLNLIALITSTAYMILSIKGRRSNFVFSIFSVIACAAIAGMSQFYGTAVINILYYLPCAFIGFYLWGRHTNKKHEVVARKLTLRQLIIIISLTVAASILVKFILDLVGGASTSLDGPAAVISIVANILVLLRYREQWFFWLATDALQLVLWTTTNNLAMLTLRILYPITAIYGYIYWRKLVKTPHKRKK